MKTIRANLKDIEDLVDCEIITLVNEECDPISVDTARQRLAEDEPVAALAMSGLRLSVDVEESDGEKWVLTPLNPI